MPISACRNSCVPSVLSVASLVKAAEPSGKRAKLERTELTEVHINVIPKVSLTATFGLGNQCRTSRRLPTPSARRLGRFYTRELARSFSSVKLRLYAMTMIIEQTSQPAGYPIAIGMMVLLMKFAIMNR